MGQLRQALVRVMVNLQQVTALTGELARLHHLAESTQQQLAETLATATKARDGHRALVGAPAMIATEVGRGRGLPAPLRYVTRDVRKSKAEPHPTTSDRVRGVRYHNIGLDDDPAVRRTTVELAARILQSLATDAPALKAAAGVSAGGRKSNGPLLLLTLSWDRSKPEPPIPHMLSAGTRQARNVGPPGGAWSRTATSTSS